MAGNGGEAGEHTADVRVNEGFWADVYEGGRKVRDSLVEVMIMQGT